MELQQGHADSNIKTETPSREFGCPPAVRDAIIKDSGERRSFSTGSQRDTAIGKGRYDLLPPRALHLIAKHFEAGAVKYQDRNWEKGQPLSVYMNSGLRHANKHLAGLRDEPHLEAAIWNFIALLDTKERIDEGLLPKELDDLPAVLTNVPKCFQ